MSGVRLKREEGGPLVPHAVLIQVMPRGRPKGRHNTIGQTAAARGTPGRHGTPAGNAVCMHGGAQPVLC